MKNIVWLALLFATHSIYCQVTPKPVLVDEFGPTKCDEILARIDNLSIQLNNNPGARALVTISGSNSKLIQKLELEVYFTSGSVQRRAEMSRIRLVRGPENGEARMKFWLVPVGANEPDITATVWDLGIPSKTKPFYFFADGDSICMYHTAAERIKELLKANPKLRVNVVVNSGNLKTYQKLRLETIGSFGHEYSERLRFFHVRDSYPESRREYWLVP